ncbi:unnamed protein product [Lota lota]
MFRASSPRNLHQPPVDVAMVWPGARMLNSQTAAKQAVQICSLGLFQPRETLTSEPSSRSSEPPEPV